MEPTDGPRSLRAGAVTTAPDRPAEQSRSRPHVDLPVGGSRNGPALMPRFTPRQNPPPGTAPQAARHARHEPRRPVVRRNPSARAVIGDEIRIPIMWCQFGSCIARYTQRGALGERHLRALALAAGWRYDALGRLACPDCAQQDPTFWATRPPALVTERPGTERWRRAG
jgi:hypothetical protein